MYCSSCGRSVTPGLSYCNYCGVKLSGTRDETVDEQPNIKPELLVSAITALFILGMVAIIMLMGA